MRSAWAALEAKSNPNAAAPIAAQPVAASASVASAAARGPNALAGSTTTLPGTNAIAKEAAVASVIGQGTEKGKSGMAKPQTAEPLAFADFTWLNGNARTKEVPLDTKFFTPEIRADISYIYDFNHPKDDTIGGSSEVFRHNVIAMTTKRCSQNATDLWFIVDDKNGRVAHW